MEGTRPGTADLESNSAQAGHPPAAPSKDIPKSVQGAIFSSSPILDLSQRRLQHLGDILKIPTLKVSGACLGVLCTDRVDISKQLTPGFYLSASLQERNSKMRQRRVNSGLRVLFKTNEKFRPGDQPMGIPRRVQF